MVRVSGPGAIAAASRVFRCVPPLDQAPSHTLHHGFLLLPGGGALDEGVAAVFRAPRSYTGEDVVEISCHGGALLPKRALDLLLAAGARLAGPGEFTRRAFLNGKMDLAQAEAVADLIAARSEDLRRLALAQLRGGLSARVEALREKTLSLLARLEANLDFAEEEVPDVSGGEARNHLKSLEEAARALLVAGGRSRLLREGISAVIVGAPNVGKSSLFNALLNEDRAIVASEPGTTRDTLEETVLLEGVPVRLVDTAGRRDAPGAVEAEGIARARRALAGAGAAILVVDAAGAPGEAERRLAAETAGKPAVLVVNKLDLAGPADTERWRAALAWPGPAVGTSAARGQGLRELGQALIAAAGGARGAGGAEAAADAVYLNARQEEKLGQAAAAFARARGAPEEAAALELRAALEAMNALTGRANLSEEVLDAIFSRFCIGK